MKKLLLMLLLMSGMSIVGLEGAAAGAAAGGGSGGAVPSMTSSACVECGKSFEPGDVAVQHACDHWFHRCCLERSTAATGERYCSHCLCSTCLEPLGQESSLIKKFDSCHHMLHALCAAQWRNQCPLCNHGKPAVQVRKGWTALHYGVHDYNEALVVALWKADVEINAADDLGRTALHIAAIQGNLDMIRLLMAAGANINAVTLEGFTPLHAAAFLNKTAAMRVLIEEYSADIRLLTENDETVLHFAANHGGSVMELVLEHVTSLGDFLAFIDKKDVFGYTALHVAASSGNISGVEELLLLGAAKHIKNLYGKTARECAAENGRLDIVELLDLYTGA